MKNKNTLERWLSVAAITAGSVAAVYTFVKTYNSVKGLDKVSLDFGNDPLLSSFFKKD